MNSPRPESGASRSTAPRGRHWTPMELIKVSAEYLADQGIDGSRLDAELLLGHVLGTNRLGLYLDHERPILPDELDRYRELMRRRGQREPLQLLVGHTQILDHEFLCRSGVFIPRPETETLILKAGELSFTEGTPARILDVGVGTGCVGLSLLTHWPQARLVGVDRNPAAVELAQENARELGVADRVEFIACDFAEFEASDSFELVVSNPPYVATADAEQLEPEVIDHDPRESLFAGEDGLDVLRRLVGRGHALLQPGGWLLFEHGHDQGESAAAMLRETGYQEVFLEKDLGGRPRVSGGRRPPDSAA